MNEYLKEFIELKKNFMAQDGNKEKKQQKERV